MSRSENTKTVSERRRIFKYEVPVQMLLALPQKAVTMPKGAVILSVGLQETENDAICVVWADVDLFASSVERRVFGVWTGATPPEGGRFVGTAITAGGEYVVHVYDLGEGANVQI